MYPYRLRLNTTFLDFVCPKKDWLQGNVPEEGIPRTPESIAMARVQPSSRMTNAMSNMTVASMYLTDPPCTTALIASFRDSRKLIEASLRNSSGLQWRDIIQAAGDMDRGSEGQERLQIQPMVVSLAMIVTPEDAEEWEKDGKGFDRSKAMR